MSLSIIDIAIFAVIYISAGQGFAWMVVRGCFNENFNGSEMKAVAAVVAVGWAVILPLFGIITPLYNAIQNTYEKDTVEANE